MLEKLDLRDKVESRLNDEVIIIACDKTWGNKDNNEKVIFFNYDAKKVAAVKTLSSRKYDACDKCWKTTLKLSAIRDALKDYKLEIVYFFNEVETAAKWMQEDDFYKNNQDVNIVFTCQIREERREKFEQNHVIKHGLTMIKDEVYIYNAECGIEQFYMYLKLA